MAFSLGAAEYHQIPSPPGFVQHTQPLPSIRNTGRNHGRRDLWFDPPAPDLDPNRSSFFWTQLQKEESHLSEISDAVLLTPDAQGKT